MKVFEDFILNKNARLETESLIGVQFPWENLDTMEFHKLISERQINDYRQYYLFNCIKIFQRKI